MACPGLQTVSSSQLKNQEWKFVALVQTQEIVIILNKFHVLYLIGQNDPLCLTNCNARIISIHSQELFGCQWNAVLFASARITAVTYVGNN